MRRPTRFLWTAAMAAILVGILAALPAGPISAGPAKPDSPFKHFGEVTKDSEHLSGFLDLYRVRDKVYLEIPVDRLGEEMLLVSSLSQGIGAYGILGGMPTNIFDGLLVKFERRGDRIHFVQVNHRFRAPEGSPEANAVNLSHGNSILASFPVLSERHEGDEVGVVPEPPAEEKKDESKDDDKAEASDEKAEEGESAETGDEVEVAEAESDTDAEDTAEAVEEVVEEEEKPVVSVVVEFTPLLLSDLVNLGEMLNDRLKSGYGLDGDRSYVERVSVYPKNAEFNTHLTFKTSKDPGLASVIDSRYVTVGVHHSFSELPKDPMTPRYADDRVGYFLSVHKDYSLDRQKDWWVRYTNRWRLEKKYPNQELSEPVEPIVYYIENTVPVEYRPYLKKGVEVWQKAFEAAGFKNAIIAKEQPDDPEWSAEDVRYSTLRWITSHQASFGAIGPSRTDPRTGEILDADILFEANMVVGFRNNHQRLVTPGIGFEDMDPFDYMLEGDRLQYNRAFEIGGPEMASKTCSAAHSLPMAGAFLQAALMHRGDLEPGKPLPIEFVGEALVWVTAHEVGHTLGLRHNFRSSNSVPFELLHDKEYVAENGLYASVMEYPNINVSRDAATQGYYYTPTVGTYDVWAIRYGYSEFKGVRHPKDEMKQLAAIASEAADPMHPYGTDEEWYLPGSVDPFVNTGDLSGNPLAWAMDRTEYVTSLFEGLEDRMVADGDSWSNLTIGMNTLLGHYYGSMNYISRYVGGMQTSRAHKGDPGAGAPMVMIEPAKQREAIQFLAGSIFSENPLPVEIGYLEHLEPNRWGHWGSGMSNRLDYPLHTRILAMQAPVLRRVTHPLTLSRMLEAEMYAPDAFSMIEMFETLNSAIWTEVVQPAGYRNGSNVSTPRRGVQRMWLDRLIEVAFTPEDGMPADASAVARMVLLELDAKIDGALEHGATLDGYTKAHLIDCDARIRTAFEAGYQLELLKKS